MRNKETLIGIASILLSLGGGGVIGHFLNTTLVLVLCCVFIIVGIIIFIYVIRLKKPIEGQQNSGVSIFARKIDNKGKISSQGQDAKTTIVSEDIKNTGTIESKKNDD